MSYKAYVVEVKELRPHANADRLQIATVFGNDVVVGLDVKAGDRMVYFPTDGQLSEEFATKNNLVRTKDVNGNNSGGYLDPEKRNIKAIKLRGEKSDGLLISFESLYKVIDKEWIDNNVKVGDMVSVLNGVEIAKKYIPQNKNQSNQSNKKTIAKKVSLKETYPLFKEHEDTEQLRYNLDSFHEGDIVTMTLKLHGTSQREMYSIKNTKKTFADKLLGLFKTKKAHVWEHVSGTRRVILESYDGGFYGSNAFRKQYHDYFDGKLEKGESVFGEIVGYLPDGKTIMPIADNKKMNDKEFIKTYGETTTFSYGCEEGKSEIYVYRMTMTNEDGTVVEYPTWLAQLRCEQMNVKHVPVLDRFTYTSEKDLLERVSLHESGTDPIGKTHIREGIVLRIENRPKFTAFKQKSFEFKVLEGIIKDSAEVPDMEEQQETE